MIHILDNETINKIAAGEVVEKPLNVVKELVENAIDANSSAITVEIKGGGIDYIRVTDNGDGISGTEVKTAFLRHATSKISTDEDLHYLTTLGFRGEALASIAAVSMVEMITKTEESLTGTRIVIEGGEIKEFEEIGAPKGTTIVVRNLFFNVPPRKKFLHSAASEGAAIVETMQRLALSIPGLSFKVVVNGSVKFMTNGNGDLKEVIYRIYGRATSDELVPISVEKDGIRIEGYLGRPVIARANRGDETIFINSRYIKSAPISKGIEEGYKTLLMMHRFPFCVLHFNMDTTALDVNIHPNKMQVRIDNQEEITKLLAVEVRQALISRNLIPDIAMVKEEEKTEKIVAPEPFETNRITNESEVKKSDLIFDDSETNENRTVVLFNDKENAEEEKEAELKRVAALNQSGSVIQKKISYFEDEIRNQPKNTGNAASGLEQKSFATQNTAVNPNPALQNVIVEKPEQYTMFENEFFTNEAKEEFEVIGQVFDTYWIIALKDKFYYMDQHAAHEKINFETFMKKFHEGKLESQNLMPPCIIQLKPSEYQVFDKNRKAFENLSFEIDDFGQDAVAIHAVPTDLFGYSMQELFMDVLEELSTVYSAKNPTTVEERIATRSCKAAIKGNTVLSKESAKKLIEKLFTLENPYQCPHGRPTLVAVSKTEMEKMFKRIV
ncbi:MAG: DNA mismatch repair endonuclease MutL [Lachnospiraceae bacterium]|nr:DNA mismatch repair endonuclease MutL [Lachnospiraceae bacterium]